MSSFILKNLTKKKLLQIKFFFTKKDFLSYIMTMCNTFRRINAKKSYFLYSMRNTIFCMQ